VRVRLTPSPTLRFRLAMGIVGALATVGLVALGLSAPAFATPAVQVTIKVVNKAGVALPASEMVAIEVANGVEVPGDVPVLATAVSGKPGYFTAALVPGEIYTLNINPTGTAELDGTWEYLGGGEDLAEAQTFVPSSTNTFITATFATEGAITGKVTSPTGVALKNAEADAFIYGDGNWESVSYAMTNSAGVYTLDDLAPGSYKLKFFSPTSAYPPIYSGQSTTLDGASAVSITPGKTVTANARFLTHTGSISGTALIDYDGNDYADEGATAVAFPVLTTDGSGNASTYDVGQPVSSGVIGSRGTYTISNLQAGTYVVSLQPAYYNEAAMWVGASGYWEPVGDAEVFTIPTAGAKLTASMVVTEGNDLSEIGSQPNIYVTNANGTAGVAGAQVALTSDVDGFVYVSGVSTGSINFPVTLTYGDGSDVEENLQPGWYTVTVIDPTGQHEPYSHDQYFDFDSTNITVNLANVSPPPSFTTDPSISQTDRHVGTQYTVAGQVAARSDSTFTYEWLRDGKPIYGATDTSYTSTGADLGAQLSVRVSASSFGFDPIYATASVTSGVEIAGAAPTNTGDAPSITPATGGAYFGTTLQAHVGGWSATGLKFHYQWMSGATVVGTDSNTYVVAAGDVAQPVTVQVTATKTGYADSTPVTSPVAVVPAPHPAPLLAKAPAVTKVYSKGVTTYTATAGTWSVAGLTYTYQWVSGGSPLGSSAKLVLPGVPTWSDPLEFTVTTVKPGYLQGSKTLIVQKGTAAFTETTPPLVHDTDSAADIADPDDVVHVGEHLSVSQHANWTVASAVTPDGYSYQWYRQSTAPGKLPVAIVGATASTYVVAAADIGQLLSVRETTVSATYTAASAFAPAGIGTISQLLVTGSPAVTVRGVGAQGQVLSAVVSAWPVTGVATAYQWVDCPSGAACDVSDTSTYLPISKATKSTLTVISAYGSVAVWIIGTKAGYASETVFSSAASLLAANTVANLTAPTISGTSAAAAHVGVKLTAVTGKFSVASVVPHYVWQVQECAPLSCDPGAWTQASGTGSATASYTPSATDLGSGGWSIRVEETVTRAGYEETGADDSAAVAIAVGTIKLVKAPTLTTSTGAFGVTAGTYLPAGGTTSVQWYTDDSADPIGNSYTRDTATDAGKAIYAKIIYSVPGYTDYAVTVLAQHGTMTAAAETVTGAAFGDPLGISTPTPFTDVAGTPVALSYQWYSNSVAIKGATASIFHPSTAYIGHHIQVRVTGSTALYNTLSTESPYAFVLGTGGLGDLTAPSISYTGALQPGTVMTSVPGTGYVPSAVTLARQWQKSVNGGTTWVSIAKATAVTYTPAATDVGTEFRAEVISSKVGYATQTQWSEAETVLNSPTLATITPPVVTGAGQVGNLLTANPGTWNATTLVYTYQWYRDDVLIPGATASTFTPDFTDATDTISFTVTASRVGYLPVTVTSNDQVIDLGTIVATVVPKVTALSATTYGISTGAWAVDGLTFSYQWQVAGVPVTGATTDSYTRAGSDVGVLSVVVTAVRTGYSPFVITVDYPTALKAIG
jgi:hypothetical protein